MKSQNKNDEVNFFTEFSTDCDYDIFTEDFYSKIIEPIKSIWPKLEKIKMLEAGCGTGAFGKRFLKYFDNLEVIGVDITPKMVERANDGTKNYSAIVGDLEKISFSDSFFDIILCPYILHHFPDISRVIENFGKWIKNGGFVIIVEPNGSNPVNRLSKIVRRFLELILGKDYIMKNKWATPNETDHSVRNYKKIFLKNKFKPIMINGFFINIKPNTDKVSIFVKMKVFLYDFFRILFPKNLFSANNVMIIFVKE